MNILNNGRYAFSSESDSPFDPPGPGDESNCELVAALVGQGPKTGEESNTFAVSGKLEAVLRIRDKIRAEVAPPGQFQSDVDLKLEVNYRSVSVTINPDTGSTSFVHASGIATDDDVAMPAIGRLTAELTTQAAFKVSGSFSLEFVSAYTGGVEATLSIKEILGIGVNAEIDPNNLGTLEVTPTDLDWSIVKVKKIYKNGKVIREEDPIPVTAPTP